MQTNRRGLSQLGVTSRQEIHICLWLTDCGGLPTDCSHSLSHVIVTRTPRCTTHQHYQTRVCFKGGGVSKLWLLLSKMFCLTSEHYRLKLLQEKHRPRAEENSEEWVHMLGCSWQVRTAQWNSLPSRPDSDKATVCWGFTWTFAHLH